MLHQVDFDEDARQLLPSCPSVEELCQFRTSAERHGAYENLWRGVTYAGILFNTALWIGM